MAATGVWARFRVVLALAALCCPAARGVEVTISLVTAREGQAVPLKGLQELRQSPFGGWVVATWPFSLRVDDEPLMPYKSQLQELLERSSALDLAGGDPLKGRPAGTLDEAEPEPFVPSALFRFARPSTAMVDLRPGEHVITPGDLRFSVGADGSLTTDDPRLRVLPGKAVVEVPCHPVSIRAFAGDRTVAFPFRVRYANVDLLADLAGPIEELERRTQKPGGAPEALRFRRIVLYLPSDGGKGKYRLLDVPFAVDAAGKVSVGRNEAGVAASGGELRVVTPELPVARHLVGVRRLDAEAAAPPAGHPGLPLCPVGASSRYVTAPPGRGRVRIAFAQAKGKERTVLVPNTFDSMPFKTVMHDGASGASWLFETGQFAVAPGGRYACRLVPIGGGRKPARELPCRFEPLYRKGKSVPTTLTGPGDGTFSGPLPAAVAERLWQIVFTGGGPLEGRHLGLVLVTKQKSPATVSLYTYRNRAVFLRGDSADLYWTVRTPQGARPAGAFEVVLLGTAFERRVAQAEGTGARVATGHARIDTSGLAPGLYEVRVRPQTLVSYPTHFFVCQREPVSEFGLNSYSPFGESAMSAGTPILTHYGQGTGAGEPGLEPAADWARSGLDAAYAVYASAPGGPAIERFLRPSEDAIGLMTLARLGKRAILRMPSVLHHEEWNPKHTLPEELRRLRRRNALWTQKHADSPGFGGITLNWFATTRGYWEESKRLDGHQERRNAEAARWVSEQAAKRVEAEKAKNPDPKHLEAVGKQAGYEAWSRVLPRAYEQYLADAKAIRPGLTSHTGLPSFWLGRRASYPPLAYSTVSHRDCVDYTDYGRPPWGNFRAPAFLEMHNPQRQRTQMSTATIGRHARFIVAFGAAGRGLDSFAFPSRREPVQGDHAQLLRIFERFGSYFSALDPLPDVAVYFSKRSPWPHQTSVVLHDLARLRRPGMLLAEEDILAGELSKYRVLFLAGVGEDEPPAVREAFARFAARGGHVVKDGSAAKSVPGIDVGFAYDATQVHRGWGLGGPNGEWEFAHLWTHFLKDREQGLLRAFAKAPTIPVSTSDREILISPLAGRESICCFVINATYAPMSVQGKWRQHAALARRGDLLVEEGWHVHDLLTGKPRTPAQKGGRRAVELDFSRAEGRVFLLTKRPPAAMAMRVARRPAGLLVHAWLEDAQGRPLVDPMPFEVSLAGPDGASVFHKYAALAPDRGLEVPVPEMRADAALKLEVRDLVLGRSATQAVRPRPLARRASARARDGAADCIGAEHVSRFLRERKQRVIVLLDEGQDAYREAAGAMAALLKRNGREARVMRLDPAEVHTLPLRWQPTDQDKETLRQVAAGERIAWRAALTPWNREFDDPRCGYQEYGPRLRIDGDVVLFGGPADNRALEDVQQFLLRTPSPNYPSPGGFFIHYLWDPFLGGCDALAIGCNDASGATAAVRHLAGLKKPTAREPAGQPARPPVAVKGGKAAPLEDMLTDKFGARILDAACAPSGRRIFLTLDSYGDSLFVLDPEGKVLHRRPIANRLGNSVFFGGSGALRPLGDEQTHVRVGAQDYLLDVTRGFVSRSASPPHGLPHRVRVRPGGPVLFEDTAHRRTYLGGKCRLVAVDDKGRLLWRYNDADRRTSRNDMLWRRSLFIRGVSPDGRRLVATAFGVAQDVYAIGQPRNPSVLCFDTASGKVLWSKDGLYLNQGKAIVGDERVVVVDDDGRFHLLSTATGEAAGTLRPVGGTDVMLPVPGTDRLLIVENTHFDAHGPSSRAYLRGPGESPDIVLDLPGRIRDAALAPGGTRIVLSSRRGETACFGLDGSMQWRAAVPAGGIVRFSPDGGTTLVGSEVGKLFFIDTATGAVRRNVDFNRYNVTTPEQFVQQMGNIGDVPVAAAARIPPVPPEPSYLDSLDAKAVSFGPNLLHRDSLLAKLKPGRVPPGDAAQPKVVARLTGQAELTLAVEPGSTYLVEFLNAAAEPGKLTPQTRLEVTVSGAGRSRHLPFTGRLPIGTRLTRRRMAFRTDGEREVVLRLRAVVPTATGEGRRARATYSPCKTSPMAVLIGDTVVAAVRFRSRNLVGFEKPSVGALRPGRAASAPRGWLDCEIRRWSGGDSTHKKWVWKAPRAALRLVDGLLGNQETQWQETRDTVTGRAISHAIARVSFKKRETVTAIAIYEDNRGPVPSADAARETTSAHYGITINDRRVGYVAGNTNLVNIFTFPPMTARAIDYFWAGREFTDTTDGKVRMAEFEVYSTDDLDVGLEGDGDDAALEGLDLE